MRSLQRLDSRDILAVESNLHLHRTGLSWTTEPFTVRVTTLFAVAEVAAEVAAVAVLLALLLTVVALWVSAGVLACVAGARRAHPRCRR